MPSSDLDDVGRGTEPNPIQPEDQPELMPGITSEHPSECSDEREFGPFRVLGMSLIGSKNALSGTPREDAYAAVPIPGGGLVVAVADGVSAAYASRVAAMAAATAAARSIADTAADPATWHSRCELALSAAYGAIAEAEGGVTQRRDSQVLGTIDQQRGSSASTTLAFAELRALAAEVQLNWCVLGDTRVMLLRGSGTGRIEELSHPEGAGGGRAPDQLGSSGRHGEARSGQAALAHEDWVVVGTDGAVEAPIRARATKFVDVVRAWRPADGELRVLLRPLFEAQVTLTFAARDDRTAVFVGPSAGSEAVRPKDSAAEPDDTHESAEERLSEGPRELSEESEREAVRD